MTKKFANLVGVIGLLTAIAGAAIAVFGQMAYSLVVVGGDMQWLALLMICFACYRGSWWWLASTPVMCATGLLALLAQGH
jgi:hypothetical protein